MLSKIFSLFGTDGKQDIIPQKSFKELAYERLIQAKQNLNNADTEFIDIAVFEYNAAMHYFDNMVLEERKSI